MPEHSNQKRSTNELFIKWMLFSATVVPSILSGAMFYSLGIMRWLDFALMFAGMFVAQLAGDYLFYFFANFRPNSTGSSQKTYPGWKPFFAGTLLDGNRLFLAGLFCLAIDAFIGVYFVVSCGWQVALFAFAGGALIILLTPFSFVGLRETSAFLGFGPLAMSGMMLVMSGKMFVPEVVAASIPVGLWVAIVAHFKSAKIISYDTEKSIIHLTTNKTIVILMTVLSYIALIAGVILRYLPAYSLLGLVSIFPMFIAINSMFDKTSSVSNYVKSATWSITALVAGGLLMTIAYFI